MQVIDRLGSLHTIINHHPVQEISDKHNTLADIPVASTQALILGYGPGSQEKMAQQLTSRICWTRLSSQQEYGVPVLIFRLLYHGDPHPGNDKEVNRGLWSNITECHTLLILVEELGRDGAIQDLVKDGRTSWAASIGRCSLTHHADSSLDIE